MKTPTGISSTTKTVRTSRRRTGSSSSEGAFCAWKVLIRTTLGPPTYAARSSPPA
jgi:hypothetical protein